MRDSVGRFDSALVLGASSEIAAATVRGLVAQGTRSVTLCARDPGRVGDLREELIRSGVSVTVAQFDADDVDRHPGFVERVFAGPGDFDLVLLAFGVLPRPESALDRDAALAALSTNAVGALSLLTLVGERLADQGHGTLVVLSSVAAVLPRSDNAAYAASKAALDSFAGALRDDLAGKGVEVLVVRPGYVRTQMTRGLRPAPLATTPEAVAAAILRGLHRRTSTVWAPAGVRPLVAVLRRLPKRLLRGLAARGGSESGRATGS